MWSGDDDLSSPATLNFVTIDGNGGDSCEKGGGLYATTVAESGVSMRKKGADGIGERGDSSDPLLLTVSGCVIANNTAQQGGGIAVDLSSTSLSPWSLSPPASPDERTLPHISGVERGLKVQPSGDDGRETGRRDIVEALESIPRKGGIPYVSRPVLMAGSLSEGGVSGVVINGPTVVSGNRATSGGGVWASGMAVSAVGGGVVVRGNVAGGMADGCADEVSEIEIELDCLP